MRIVEYISVLTEYIWLSMCKRIPMSMSNTENCCVLQGLNYIVSITYQALLSLAKNVSSFFFFFSKFHLGKLIMKLACFTISILS